MTNAPHAIPKRNDTGVSIIWLSTVLSQNVQKCFKKVVILLFLVLISRGSGVTEMMLLRHLFPLKSSSYWALDVPAKGLLLLGMVSVVCL